MIFEARFARRRQIFAAVVFWIILVAGLWIAGLIGPMVEYYPITGALMAGLSAIAIAIVATRLLKNEVQLRIDGEGVHWKKLRRSIPWDQIVGAGIVVVNRVPMLCLALKDPAAYPLASPVARLFAMGDRALGFGAMGLNTVNLDKPFDAMVQTALHYRPDLLDPVVRL